MTFLEIVKEVLEESGSVSLDAVTSLSTLSGASGRILRAANWTERAWTKIQNQRGDWRWMEEDFAGSTVAGTRYYQSADSRFRDWIYNANNDPRPSFTIYDPAIGQDDEGGLVMWPWKDFRGEVLVGSRASETGKPRLVAIDPQNQIALYPTPDATYTIRGRYRRSAQTLVNDADVPEMPAVHHDVIKWRALVFLAAFDEAVEVQLPYFQSEYRDSYEDLLHAQTPRVTTAGSLDDDGRYF